MMAELKFAGKPWLHSSQPTENAEMFQKTF